MPDPDPMRQPWPQFRAAAARAGAAAIAAIAFGLAGTAAADPSEVSQRAGGIEAYLSGHPEQAQREIDELLAHPGATLRETEYLTALSGRALVTAGRVADAGRLADRLERESQRDGSREALATALLVRSALQSSTGNASTANALAHQALAILGPESGTYATHWALLAIGRTARERGRRDEAMESLHDALARAEREGNALRRSQALYELSVLHLVMKQGDRSLQAALDAYRDAETAGSAYAMADARMAESAACEILHRPERELAAMQEALAIARKSRSKIAESRALVNLADIELRRQRYREALDAARRSLQLAAAQGNVGIASTSKANIGFALFGLGRVQEGRRYTEEALASYERQGATAELAGLLGEYAQYLEKAGEYKAALALSHRERALNDEIAAATHERSVLELQEKYESDKHRREIELLARENDVKTAQLAAQSLQERGWWLLALVFAFSFVVVATLYRKLVATNRLLGEKNRELSIQSSRDPLTALYNRRYFQQYIGEAGIRADRRRDEGQSVEALLLIDLDYFKEINDRHGHAAGDAVLVDVAHRLRDTLRETDMIVRWGGEEFLVYVPATHADKLDEIALRIMHAIAAEPFVRDGTPIRLSASVGYVPMPLPPRADALPWERAIALADMALYLAKVDGRNRGYGIRALANADDATLSAVERDLPLAWREGLVDVHVLSGSDVAGGLRAAEPIARAAVPREAAGAANA
jgi:diguanylate cyclase (GGDEF)-like protein